MNGFTKLLFLLLFCTIFIISFSGKSGSSIIFQDSNIVVRNDVNENIWWLNVSFLNNVASSSTLTFPHGITEESAVNGLVYPVIVQYYNGTFIGFSKDFPTSASTRGSYNIVRYNSTDISWTTDRSFVIGDEVRIGFGKLVNFTSDRTDNTISVGSISKVPQTVVLNMSGWNGTIRTGTTSATMTYDSCSVGSAGTGCAGYVGCSETGNSGRMIYGAGDPYCWWTYDSSNIISHEQIQTEGSFSCTHWVDDYGSGCDGTCNENADLPCGKIQLSDEVWKLDDCYCRRTFSSSCTGCSTYYFYCIGGSISNVFYYAFFYPNMTALVVNPSTYGNPDYSTNYHWRYDSGASGTKFNQTGNATQNLKNYFVVGSNQLSFDSSSSEGDGLSYVFFEYQPEFDAPTLERNYTFPFSPAVFDTVDFYAEINNSDDGNLIDYARLTVVAPNGTTIVDSVNGSYDVINADYDLNWSWDTIAPDDGGDWLWYVNWSDNASYTDSVSNSFYITDTTVPSHVEIVSPLNNSLPTSTFNVKVVAIDDVRLDKCWIDIQFFNGSSWVADNATFVCGSNTTVSNLWLDEDYWLFLYANDTSNNVNFSQPINVSVLSDTSPPIISILYPSEGAGYTTTAGGRDNISWSVIDNVLVHSCNLYTSNADAVNTEIFDSSEANPNNNVTLCCKGCANSCPSNYGGFNITIGYAVAGNFNYSITCNDSSDVLSENSISFTVTTPSAPPPGPGGGGGGGVALKCPEGEAYDTTRKICIKILTGNETNLTLMPSIIHTYFPYIPFLKGYKDLEYSIKSNWALQQASITKGPKEYNVSLEQNTTIKIFRKIDEENFVAKTESLEIQAIDVYGRTAFSKPTFTMINLGVYIPTPRIKAKIGLPLFLAEKNGYVVGVRVIALMILLLSDWVIQKYLRKQQPYFMRLLDFVKKVLKKR